MAKPPYNKYGNTKVTVDGLKFDSKKEAKRWLDLKMLEKAGHIGGLKRQVPYLLEGRDGPILTPTGRRMKYLADFVYIDWKGTAHIAIGSTVVEDAKGFRTPEYLIKKAILAAQGIVITEV